VWNISKQCVADMRIVRYIYKMMSQSEAGMLG
jgi:hypothetical protein